MSSNNFHDEVFVEKRRPKNPIKFKIQLNEEQKEAKKLNTGWPISNSSKFVGAQQEHTL